MQRIKCTKKSRRKVKNWGARSRCPTATAKVMEEPCSNKSVRSYKVANTAAFKTQKTRKWCLSQWRRSRTTSSPQDTRTCCPSGPIRKQVLFFRTRFHCIMRLRLLICTAVPMLRSTMMWWLRNMKSRTRSTFSHDLTSLWTCRHLMPSTP